MKMRRILVAILVLWASVASAQTKVISGGAAGSGGITAGAAATGCSAFSLVYVDTSGNLACAKAPINGATSTAGTAIQSWLETITGASATSNWYNVTGTAPATLTAATYMANFVYTGDDDNQLQGAVRGEITAGATASFLNAGVIGSAASGGGNLNGGYFTTADADMYGVVAQSTGSGTTGAGIIATAQSASARTFGVIGSGNAGTPGAASTGVFGLADSDAATGFAGIWGRINASTIGPASATPSLTHKAAGVFDNTTAAADILIGTDNTAATSNTAAWAGWRIVDGGQQQNGLGVLTSSTMTPTIVSEQRTVTHSYAWTNAMVTALGAVLTGDITVATLPAKTRVDGALVVIDTAAGGVTTLTVSCGDAIGGAPFNQYIVASDAKAAANTVYGDLISGAETGTALFDATTKWFPNYVPSYTTTTLVTCRFISTGTNLNTVTTSTGRVILTTTLLP